MMNRHLLTLTVVFSSVAATASGQGGAPAVGDQLTALYALESIQRAYGGAATGPVVEMIGEGGQPQPREWFVTVRDPASPTTLHTFWASRTRTTDEGPNSEFYPTRLPLGFIDRSKLTKDSADAFTVANAAADRAGIGFDSLSYRLRSREFDSEPVWDVTLYNRNRTVAGAVSVSGLSGAVLRTVWFRRGRSPEPRVEDSAATPGTVAGTPPWTPGAAEFQQPAQPQPQQPQPQPGFPASQFPPNSPVQPGTGTPPGQPTAPAGANPGTEVPEIVPVPSEP